MDSEREDRALATFRGAMAALGVVVCAVPLIVIALIVAHAR